MAKKTVKYNKSGTDKLPNDKPSVYTITTESGKVYTGVAKRQVMVKKTVKYNKSGIDKLPNDKPAVYKIMTESGKTVYTGVAKRGRVRDRLEEHLRRGKDRIPGTAVKIEQVTSISKARGMQSRIIKKTKPKYNAQRAVISFFEPDSFSEPKGRNAVKKRTEKK